MPQRKLTLHLQGLVSPPTPQSPTSWLKQDRYRFTSAATLDKPIQPQVPIALEPQRRPDSQFGLSLTKALKPRRTIK